MARRCWPRRGGWPRRVGALTADWHGFNVLHTAAARVGALDLGFVPGASGKSLAQMLGGGVDRAVAARRRRVRHGADRRQHVRHLSGPSRRRRRGARRRDPARRRLHRKVRHLRQHRGPRAARAAGGLSARRGARGLEDPARVQRDDRSRAAVRHDRRSCARGWSRSTRCSPASTSCRASAAPTRAGPSGDPAALSDAPFEPAIANYYQTDPISRASPTMAACTATFAATPLAPAAE